MNDGLDVELFGRHQGKSFRKVKSHLVPEGTDRTGPGPVTLANALVENVAEEILIYLQFI